MPPEPATKRSECSRSDCDFMLIAGKGLMAAGPVRIGEQLRSVGREKLAGRLIKFSSIRLWLRIYESAPLSGKLKTPNRQQWILSRPHRVQDVGPVVNEAACSRSAPFTGTLPPLTGR
jgi:hypothetical protein